MYPATQCHALTSCIELYARVSLPLCIALSSNQDTITMPIYSDVKDEGNHTPSTKPILHE